MTKLTPEERQILKEAHQDLENKLQDLENKIKQTKRNLKQASCSLTVASTVGLACLLASPKNMGLGTALGAAIGYGAAAYKENQ